MMTNRKKLLIAAACGSAGLSLTLLYLYACQLDDKMEALIRDPVEVVSLRDDFVPGAPRTLKTEKPAVIELVRAGSANRALPQAAQTPAVNPVVDTDDDPFSTFGIDVDTAAYTMARKHLEAGRMPSPARVRVEEFVNYFDYDYPSPDNGAFGVHLEAAPSPFTTENDVYLLRVGVQGRRLTADRKPVHLTFLVDVSGSMRQPDKLPLAKESLRILTNNLKHGDTVALATYAGRVAEILEPTGVEHRGKVHAAISSLRAGGGTSMSSGIELAYKLAMTNFKPGDVNRVIVLSDGDANIGPSTHSDVLARIRHQVEEGVTLSTIGFGMGSYKDTMMEQLANRGNGNYYYIDRPAQAQRVFGEQLDGTLEVIAKDVKIQVEFDPVAVPSYRLIGYENRDIADRDFRNDKVDAGEIGAGHSVTALYEVQLADHTSERLATVRIRHKEPTGYEASESTFDFTRAQVRTHISEASESFQFSTAVATFAELLRGSPHASFISYELVEEIARSATRVGQTERSEFLGLVRKARGLRS